MPETKQLLRETRDRIAPPPDVLDGLERRRRHQENVKRVAAAAVAIVVALLGFGGWFLLDRDAAPKPANHSELGIFAPVAGRIVYGDRQGLWGVDPAAPADPATRVQLTTEAGTPLGWSSDGTELLIQRRIEGASAQGVGLFVLHADGSETLATTEPLEFGGATISPDGSRVVFVGGTGALYAVDADGGSAEVLVEPHDDIVEQPTFSPDGTRIAYVAGGGDHDHHVWVIGADGNDAHEIVFNERTAEVGHAYGLAWSPAGDRIALGLETNTYTFAPDGSDFKRAITDGYFPYWSPDGSQIAYTIYCDEDPDGCGLAIADADGSNARTFDFATSGPWHPAPIPSTEPPSVPTDDVAPTLGPSTLAYGVDGDVFLADADGSNPVRIAHGVPADGADECAPGEERAEYTVFGTAWSPDGRYLAYWDWGCPVPPGAWGKVLISDAEGNVITSFPGQAWTISWSPDSTRVAVMDVWGQRDATIGVYGLNGTRQAALAVPSELTPSGDYSPVWSRDGASVLLPGVQVPLDGEAPLPLPDELTRQFFGVYSPDGSRVANIDGGTLVVDDAGGSDAQKAGGPLEYWALAWSPNGDLVAFAADGTELLVRDVATGVDTSLLDVTRSEGLRIIEFSPDGDRILFTRDVDGGPTSLWSIGVDGSDLRRLVDRIDWVDLQPRGRPS